MAGVLDWIADRTLREVEAWQARVASGRAAEAEREDGRAHEAYRGTLAERADTAVRR